MLDPNSKWRYRAGSVLMLVGGALLPAMAYLKEWVESEHFPEVAWFASSVVWLLKHSVWVISIGFLAAAIGYFWGRVGPPSVRVGIKAALDSIRSKAFPNNPSGHESDYRVTLFKRKVWSFRGFWRARGELRGGVLRFRKWPWNGWIVPVMRSGEFCNPSKTIFFAPTDETALAEGMAGQSWARNGTLSALGKAEMKAVSGPRVRQRYCEQTHTPPGLLESYVDDGKLLPRDLVAFPVLTADGRRWGSVVIDTVHAGAIDDRLAFGAFDVMSPALSALVEALK